MMSEHVWRNSSKAFRSFRNARIDDSGASYCDAVLPFIKDNKVHRGSRQKFRENVRAVKSVWHRSRQDDDAFGTSLQQDIERPQVEGGKRMKLLSLLIRLFKSQRSKNYLLEEHEEKTKDLHKRLDKMIATLDGENDWFVECHPVLEDTRKDE